MAEREETASALCNNRENQNELTARSFVRSFFHSRSRLVVDVLGMKTDSLPDDNQQARSKFIKEITKRKKRKAYLFIMGVCALLTIRIVRSFVRGCLVY